MKPNERGWIHTGLPCNQRCIFCSYQDSFHKGQKSLKKIRKELQDLKKLGMKDVTFSGGEVTIRKDIFKIIESAKNEGFRDILLITNGFMTDKMSFCKELISSGLTTITFSFQGYNAKTHEHISQSKGSFKKLIKSYENMKKLGLNIRFNTTICKENYKNLPGMAKLFIKLNPKVVNILTFFGYDDAADHFKEQCPKYSDMKPYLKKALDILDNKINEINVRYLPFCIIPEHAKHISGYHQKVYDPFEWNNITDDIRRHNKLINIYHLIRGLLSFKNKKRLIHMNWNEIKNEAMVEFIMKNSFKHESKCKSCKYYYICNGFWKSYVKSYGKKEFNPVRGKKIKSPVFFKNY